MQLTLPFCAIILAFTVGTVGQTPDGSVATLPIIGIREGSQMVESRQLQNGTKNFNNNNRNCPSIVDRKKFRDNLVKKDKGKCKKKCPKNIKKYLAKLATCTQQRGVFRGTNLCPTEMDTMAFRDALESKALNRCDSACLNIISSYKSNAKTCKSFLKKKNKRDLEDRELEDRDPRRGRGRGRGRDLEARDLDDRDLTALEDRDLTALREAAVLIEDRDLEDRDPRRGRGRGRGRDLEDRDLEDRDLEDRDVEALEVAALEE